MRRLLTVSVTLLVALFFSSEALAHRCGHIDKRQAKIWSLPLQNALADALGLERFEDAEHIRRLANESLLIKLDGGVGWYVDPDFDEGYRYDEFPDALQYARPWVKTFLDTEGDYLQKAFPDALIKVSGISRTPERQKQLVFRFDNSNAAWSWRQDRQTPHYTGSVIDVSKLGVPGSVLCYIRARWEALQDCGLITFNEEWVTNSFHVFVTPLYGAKVCDAPLRY